MQNSPENQPIQQPKAIFFDLDGTLLDSLPGIIFSLEQAFTHCGLTMPAADVAKLIGPPIRTIIATITPTSSPTTLDHLEQAFRLSYDTEGWQKTPHYDGATQTLQALAAHDIRLFVVSNKPLHIATKILETEGTLTHFEAVITKDSRTTHYASKTEMISHLLISTQLDPADCLMVGDTMEDAHAAQETQVKFVLMLHGYGDIPASAPFPAALRLQHFSELLPMMAKEQTL